MSIIKTIFTCLFIANTLAAFSQKNFLYTAHLSAADSNSFYAIPLPVSLLSKCNINLSDLRIKDDKGIEMPFIEKEYAASNDVTFIVFPIVSKTINADKKMHVVVQNTDSLFTNIGMEIQNTTASRTVNINGSNDGKQWFIVKENITVSNAEKHGSNSYFISIGLPKTNYKYFDIVFNDKDLLPVNILKAGSIYIHYNLPSTQDDTVATTAIQQKDSGKISYIQFSFSQPYPIDKLAFQITGSKYYKRELSLSTGAGFSISATINSEKNDWLAIGAKPNIFYAKIYNEDNPALKIVAVRALIKKTAVYAYLEKGKRYSLFFGDSLAQAPVYDLKYFEKLIQQNVLVASLGSIEKNNASAIEPPLPASNKKFIWLAMGAVVITLLLITIKMTKEIDKKNDAQDAA